MVCLHLRGFCCGLGDYRVDAEGGGMDLALLRQNRLNPRRHTPRQPERFIERVCFRPYRQW